MRNSFASVKPAHSQELILSALLQLLLMSRLALFSPQFLCTRNWSSLDCFLSTKRLEAIVEEPLGRMLNRLVEHVREEGHSGEAKLQRVSISTFNPYCYYSPQLDPTSSVTCS